MTDQILNPAETAWRSPTSLPPEGAMIPFRLHGAAGKAGEGSSRSGGPNRWSGATGDYVEVTRLILPDTDYPYFVPAGGSQLDCWFEDAAVACAASALNNGTVRNTSVGDLIRLGLPAQRLFAGANPIQPAPGVGGPDGDGAHATSVLVGGTGNGGLTPGGDTPGDGEDDVRGGSGARARQASDGDGPGFNGGNPGGAPTSGRGIMVSGIPGGGQIVAVIPD